jgi:hypothetical protein
MSNLESTAIPNNGCMMTALIGAPYLTARYAGAAEDAEEFFIEAYFYTKYNVICSEGTTGFFTLARALWNSAKQTEGIPLRTPN